MKHRFKRAFAPNNSPKYDLSPALDMADSIYFASKSPVYDASMEDKGEIARQVALSMDLFDHDHDVIIDSGDPVVLVMMIAYISDIAEGFYFARYNTRAGRYVVTRISQLEMRPDLADYYGEEVYDD